MFWAVVITLWLYLSFAVALLIGRVIKRGK
jgi:hypothetical protein